VASRLLEAGHDVAGLDLSSGQLSLARSKLAKCQFVQGDLTNLPFSNGSFDAVVSYYAIIHVPREEHEALLREIHRVLRHDGRACCASDGVIFPRTAILTAGSVFRCSGATSMRRRISPCYQGWASFLNGANRSPILWGMLPISSYCRYASDPANWVTCEAEVRSGHWASGTRYRARG
jgi:SAM-dependent methyltransferase